MNAIAELAARSRPTMRRLTVDLLARLDGIRTEIASATVNLEHVESERVRCSDKAATLEAKVGAVTAARTALEDIHTRKAAGEKLRNGELRQAEEALQVAQQDAERATPAAVGTRTAADRFADQIESIKQDLAALDGESRRVQMEILHAKALASRKRYRFVCERFIEEYAQHAAEIKAIYAAAKSLGIEIIEVNGRSVSVPPDGSIQLQTSALQTLPWLEATEQERKEQHGVWFFAISEVVKSLTDPLVAELLEELKI